MSAGPYREEMKRLVEQLGRPGLEGRLAGLLLAGSEPVSLSEAARALGGALASVSELAEEMLERGDLRRSCDPSTRQYRYDLADNAYLARLRVQRDPAQRDSVLLVLRSVRDGGTGMPCDSCKAVRFAVWHGLVRQEGPGWALTSVGRWLLDDLDLATREAVEPLRGGQAPA